MVVADDLNVQQYEQLVDIASELMTKFDDTIINAKIAACDQANALYVNTLNAIDLDRYAAAIIAANPDAGPVSTFALQAAIDSDEHASKRVSRFAPRSAT
jgi:hypothetical protein